MCSGFLEVGEGADGECRRMNVCALVLALRAYRLGASPDELLC